MERYPITEQGFIKLEEEIKYLKSVKRPAIINEISAAREFGDLSENAEYHAAREEQSFVERRITELEDKLARADVIDITKLSNDMVRFGATVDIVDDETEEEFRYQIVGEYEANTDKNMLSIKSPMAKALIGKAVGDIVEVHAPKGNKAYEVLNIAYVINK